MGKRTQIKNTSFSLGLAMSLDFAIPVYLLTEPRPKKHGF